MFRIARQQLAKATLQSFYITLCTLGADSDVQHVKS
jgi:hypothetical protein